MRNGLYTTAAGTTEWYLNGQLHRIDGPAIEYANGDKEWWLNGQLHRTDGPAVEYTVDTKQWWLNGQYLTFNEWLEVNDEITDSQTVLLKLRYA